MPRLKLCLLAALLATPMLTACSSSETVAVDRERYDQARAERTEPIPMTYGWAEDVEPGQVRATEPTPQPVTAQRMAPAGGAVILEKQAPNEVRVGQAFEYRINVINTSPNPVHNVVVTEQIPENFQISQTRPEAQRTEGNKIRFDLGTLGPNQTVPIRIAGQAGQAEQIVSCATVTYEPRVCMAINVVSPQLSLRATGPEEVLLCDRIPLTFQIANRGTGTAQNVQIFEQLPQGVVVADTSSDQIMINVGNLAAGETREYSVYLKPLDRGSYQFTPEARSAEGLQTQVEGNTRVTEPVLAIQTTAPQQQFVGTNLTYQIAVANQGDAGARDTIVRQQLPAGAQFIEASNGGQVQGGRIVWNLGVLPEGETRNLSFTIKPTQTGEYTAAATANAYCARTVESPIQLAVQGIPGLLLEVVDTDDPIQVGADTTYTITVVNQGSAIDRQIQLRAELEPTMQFVAVEGPTRASAEGEEIVFEPLNALQPGERATWRLTVQATEAGNNRFGVQLQSQNIGERPVVETEATTFFR